MILNNDEPVFMELNTILWKGPLSDALVQFFEFVVDCFMLFVCERAH